MGGFALLRLGEGEEAIRWMEESVARAPNDSIVHYNAACLYALAGDADRAIDCLANCHRKVGNLNREWLMHDSDLDSVREHPRFREILDLFPD
jgi:adenylate cyclase